MRKSWPVCCKNLGGGGSFLLSCSVLRRGLQTLGTLGDLVHQFSCFGPAGLSRTTGRFLTLLGGLILNAGFSSAVFRGRRLRDFFGVTRAVLPCIFQNSCEAVRIIWRHEHRRKTRGPDADRGTAGGPDKTSLLVMDRAGVLGDCRGGSVAPLCSLSLQFLVAACEVVTKLVPSANADSGLSTSGHPALPCRAFTCCHFVAGMNLFHRSCSHDGLYSFAAARLERLERGFFGFDRVGTTSPAGTASVDRIPFLAQSVGCFFLVPA